MKNGILMLSAKEAAKNMTNVPYDYSVIHWWNWYGPMPEEKIVKELDEIKAQGISTVLIGAAYNVQPRYLSPEWFDRIRFAVEEAAKRDMGVWIADEGTYPSGFAGGKINELYPELRMKALLATKNIELEEGQELSLDLTENTVSAMAIELETKQGIAFDISKGHISWVAPKGKWQVLVIEHQFCTSPTRYVHHPKGLKDTTYSLCDYLDPNGVNAFIKEVHEKYKETIGEYFGNTMIGFFGDEPDYSIRGIPWTPKIFDEFRKRKGYDVVPYVAWFFVPEPPEDALKAKADYWDVWSDMFRDNFFKPQAEWCKEHGLLYVAHLNHEDEILWLIKAEGDFFRCMKYIDVPAIDAIWRQIWMDKVADFPKYASSAAHLFGRSRVFTESFAIYGVGMSMAQIKWVIDHQLVRGVNLVLTSNFLQEGHPQLDQFPLLTNYTRRASYLLSLGKPAARIALYFPTPSLWLGAVDSVKSMLSTAQKLLENQLDFDFIDDSSILSCIDEGGKLENLSGQKYDLVIVPSIRIMNKAVFEKLMAFSRAGGKLVFAGKDSFMLYDKDIMNSVPMDEAWLNGYRADNPEELASLVRQLHDPDVLLETSHPAVKYIHRELEDCDLYFFFNEGTEKVTTPAVISGCGKAQVWYPEDCSITDLICSSPGDGKLEILLTLEPMQTKFIVAGRDLPEPSNVEKRLNFSKVIGELDGEWNITIEGKQMSRDLKLWSELGYAGYSGTAVYEKEFTIPGEYINNRDKYQVYLDCPKTLYSARVWLNGTDLGVRGWTPFSWDITDVLVEGTNKLRIEVRNTPAAEFAGTPERLEKLKEQAKTNHYLNTSLKFDVEMIPSGLLQPVRIIAFDVV